MKIMFHLALLCLLFSSCQKDPIILSENQNMVQNRSSTTVKATLVLQNGDTFQSYVTKAKGEALSDSLMTVKLHFSAVDSSVLVCKNLLLEQSDDHLGLITKQPNADYANKNECYITPHSATTIKMSILPGKIVTYPNEFIGEETDGF